MRKVLNNYGLVMSLVLVVLCSCSEDQDLRFVEADLVPYFESFVEEGAKRGIEVDFEALHVEGFIQSTNEENVVGQCSHTEEAPNAVIIDPVLWRIASESKKEQVIFHELGHCYLKRSHDDSKDASGVCISIMHSGSNICSLNYAQNRDYYLDELFKN